MSEGGILLRPSPKLLVRFYMRFIMITLFALIPTIFIVYAIKSMFPSLAYATYLSLVIVLLLALIYIPLKFNSIKYIIGRDAIQWERGVLWKRKSAVPYTKITNLDIVQDPISRILGIADIRVQTAGYSGIYVPELVILGVENPEELKSQILEKISSSRG